MTQTMWCGALVVAALAVSCWGLNQFVSRDVVEYLTLRRAFAFMDYAKPPPLFLLDYLAMMVLFGSVGALRAWALGRCW